MSVFKKIKNWNKDITTIKDTVDHQSKDIATIFENIKIQNQIVPFTVKNPPKKIHSKNKVYLFNDTFFANHVGCKAVMRSLNYQMSDFNVIGRNYVNQYFYNEAIFEKADIIIVNGEGTMHHATPFCNFLMEILQKAQNLGKKTALLNSLYQNQPDYYPSVIKNIDLLTVRGPLSLDSVQKAGAKEPIMLLDSCCDKTFLNNPHKKPLFEMERITKGTTVGGISNRTNFNLMLDLKYPFYPIINSNIPFEYVIETLKTTEVHITGQHHCIYALGLAGVPFVAVKSNSHKIEEILQ